MLFLHSRDRLLNNILIRPKQLKEWHLIKFTQPLQTQVSHLMNIGKHCKPKNSIASTSEMILSHTQKELLEHLVRVYSWVLVTS
ncbi:MAG: hypothetical protein CMF72_19785 [Mameliella sp.]|nr:hypothetical protein [Mameliella sp.]